MTDCISVSGTPVGSLGTQDMSDTKAVSLNLLSMDHNEQLFLRDWMHGWNGRMDNSWMIQLIIGQTDGRSDR